MWPHVVQFESRRLQVQRERQLVRERRVNRKRHETGCTPRRPESRQRGIEVAM